MDKTEAFILKARKIHGDKYDYSKVKYEHSKQKIIIICPEHGEFEQIPTQHLRGHGCKLCGFKYRKSANERKCVDTKSFIDLANKTHDNKYDYRNTKYVNSRTKVLINCMIHGEFSQLPEAHINGSGCPICGSLLRQEHHRVSIEELENKFIQIHGNKYKYDWTDYYSMHDKINIFCKKHNLWFKQQAVHHLNGHGCPLCAGGGKKYTTEEFIARATEIHGNLYDYSKTIYVDKETPVEIICSKHGSFWQKPHNHINGCGCQKCKCVKTQYKIYEFLKTEFPNEVWMWEYSPTWLGLQRLDIYNEKHKLAIEYNGEQHYFPLEIFGGESAFEKRKNLDTKKKKLCEENNYTLYIIKYNELDYNKLRDDINNILNFNNNDF